MTMTKKKVLMGLGLMILFLSVSGVTLAQIRAEAVSLTPFVGGYIFDDDQNLEDAFTFGLGAGYHFDENWAAEAVLNYIDTERDSGSGDASAYLYRLDALYHFMPKEKLVPFVAVGVGGLTIDPDHGSKNSDFLMNYGAGLKYFLNEDLALRADVRHLFIFDDTQNNLLFTVGATFLFGGAKKAEARPAEVPTDSDGDGVYDSMDNCPGTPRGLPVDRFGCPLDSDGDGVYDNRDLCPDTPKGSKVDETGCSPEVTRDSDEDGIPDELDQCPGTPKGATVNEFGCWVCENIHFDFNKWNIKPESYPCLDEQVELMKNSPDLKVEIQGHTDSLGSQSYNQRLSERRAMSVKDYFVSKGIEKERLSTKGLGFSKPVATNDTEEGRAKNRRIEFQVISE